MDRDDRKQNDPRSERERPRAQGRVAGEQVKQAAQNVKEAARQGAERLADEGRSQARERVGSVSRALRAAGDALRDDDEGRMSDWSRQAAEQIDRLAGYIDRKDYTELLEDVRRFARERPALFLGGMFVTGLLAGRFVRATSPERRYREDYEGAEGSEGSEGLGEARNYVESTTFETTSPAEPHDADRTAEFCEADPIIDVENRARRGDV